MTGLRAPETARRGDGSPPRTSPPRPAGLGTIGWLRWGWRQLTSMRVALILLFLMALASVPGSLFPQQGVDPASVQQYYISHPALAPWLNRLGLFNVFAAPWFAAIYLLLFISLAGCVIPRTVKLARTLRTPPPAAPRNLARLPSADRYQTTASPDEALAAAAAVLRRRRFRVRTGDGWVSAEKGHRREAGNLLFHLALLGVLLSISLGGLFGYKADKLLTQGQSFNDTVTALDVYHPGRLVSASDLAPFSIKLNRFDASYVTTGSDAGQPASFHAHISYASQLGGTQHSYDLQVNHPLVVDGVRIFLIGHGYAPIFKVTDGRGKQVFDGPVTFIAANTATYTSEGVIKVPNAEPTQLGFIGVFLPTAVPVNGQLESAFPAALNPRVSLVSYAGNLGMNDGVPQSIYQLDTSGMHRLPIAPKALAPGQSMKLPDGDGTLTFTGYTQWVSLAITYDPGQLPVLVCAIAALAGLLLSFFVRRRRIFVRARTADGGATVVSVGGLARSDAGGGFENEFAELTGKLRSAHPEVTPAAAPSTVTPSTAAPPAPDSAVPDSCVLPPPDSGGSPAPGEEHEGE